MPDAVTALVQAARLADRANALDSARAWYAAAARQSPLLADWLRLRAAGVTTDSMLRAGDYTTIQSPEARARIPWTEAQARERTGDPGGAARLYEKLGATADAFRASAALASATADSAASAAVRARLFAFVAAHPGASDSRAAVDLADRVFAPLTLAEERTVARSAAIVGPLARAAAAFERIRSAGPATPGAELLPADILSYGGVLLRLRRNDDAERAFTDLAMQRIPRATAAEIHVAQFQRARARVVGGNKDGARLLLRALVRSAPRDTVTARALILLADLAADAGDDRGARTALTAAAHRFPTSSLVGPAEFRAALIAFLSGDARTAATEWDALVHRHPGSPEATAATYWSGRAWAAAARPSVARDRWRAVLVHDPLSYYAMLSARRLGAKGSLPPFDADTDAEPLPPSLDSILARSLALQSVGMLVEAEFEMAYAMAHLPARPTTLEAVGAAFIRIGDPARAVVLGRRLLDRSAAGRDTLRRDIRLYRLLYPLRYADTVRAAARAAGLDPALVAAVIRQESTFNPRAVSVSGARGLMQIMPSIGRGLARARAIPGSDPWDPTVLDQPQVSVTLGTTHLATFLGIEGGNIPRGLAAYNAGPSRVAEWVLRRGVADDEVFVERIPFGETRDYVRAILRGREIYATVYGGALGLGS